MINVSVDRKPYNLTALIPVMDIYTFEVILSRSSNNHTQWKDWDINVAISSINNNKWLKALNSTACSCYVSFLPLSVAVTLYLVCIITDSDNWKNHKNNSLAHNELQDWHSLYKTYVCVKHLDFLLNNSHQICSPM